MKPPLKSFSDLRPASQPKVFDKPSPKVSRTKRAKVLTPEEKAAFLASRPDLQSKG